MAELNYFLNNRDHLFLHWDSPTAVLQRCIRRWQLGEIVSDCKRGFMLALSLLVLPPTWLRSLDMLAYVGFSGVLACVILIASVLGVGAFDGVDLVFQLL
jgi:hypothetical protein